MEFLPATASHPIDEALELYCVENSVISGKWINQTRFMLPQNKI